MEERRCRAPGERRGLEPDQGQHGQGPRLGSKVF